CPPATADEPFPTEKRSFSTSSTSSRRLNTNSATASFACPTTTITRVAPAARTAATVRSRRVTPATCTRGFDGRPSRDPSPAASITASTTTSLGSGQTAGVPTSLDPLDAAARTVILGRSYGYVRGDDGRASVCRRTGTPRRTGLDGNARRPNRAGGAPPVTRASGVLPECVDSRAVVQCRHSALGAPLHRGR